MNRLTSLLHSMLANGNPNHLEKQVSPDLSHKKEGGALGETGFCRRMGCRWKNQILRRKTSLFKIVFDQYRIENSQKSWSKVKRKQRVFKHFVGHLTYNTSNTSVTSNTSERERNKNLTNCIIPKCGTKQANQKRGE